MPDHMHAILRGREDTSHHLNFMKRFKQSSGFQMKRQSPPSAWQGSYYDHIILNARDFKEHCYYIVGNPVRAGLTDDYLAWPYSGSDLMELEDFLRTL